MATDSPRRLAMVRWSKLASVFLAAATAGSVVLSAQEKASVTAPRPGADTRTGRPSEAVFEVRPGMLKVVLIEPGTLQASRAWDVLCQVEGTTTIISLVPEGTKVKKGDLVCELDSASLRDKLTNQKIATQGADASSQNARLAREYAEQALKAHEEALFPQEMATFRGAIQQAESDRAGAEDQMERIWRARGRLNVLLAAKGEDRTALEVAVEVYLNDQVQRARAAVARAKSDAEQARARQTGFEQYDKPKKIKELQSEIEKSRSDELAKKQTYQLEKYKEAKLERQIAYCKLLAPTDGIVVHANAPLRSVLASLRPLPTDRVPDEGIEEGATVRERQKIISLYDMNAPMLVNTKVRETMVARVVPGQRVQVKAAAFPADVIPGTVADVAPLPDPTDFVPSDRTVYTARVRLENGPPGLRPGMSARVEILMTILHDTLSLPLRAVLESKGKHYVYLVTPVGHARREVKLGLSNETMIEVQEGLRSGDKVALDPVSLLSAEELREAFAVSKEATLGNVPSSARKAERAP